MQKKKTNERREKEAKCIEKNEGEKVILWFKFEIWIFNILNFNILKRVW
jgi:hypothetical protein